MLLAYICKQNLEGMDTEIKKGGKRNNSGRKPLPKENKKIPVTIYIEGSIVNKLGGREGLRKKLASMLSSKPDQAKENTQPKEKSEMSLIEMRRKKMLGD